jgi:transposase
MAMSHNEFTISEPIEPQEASPMKQEMHVLGIDIAKRVFHAVGMDDRGNVVYRKRLSRHDLMPCIAKLPPVLIGIEACGGAHDWARRFRAHGHEVALHQKSPLHRIFRYKIRSIWPRKSLQNEAKKV